MRNLALFEKKWRLRVEEVIYLESSMVDFSTNMFVLIDNVGGDKMKEHYSYVCGIQEVVDGEYYMTDLRTTNLAKSKFVSVVNDQFAISESQLKAILQDRIFEVNCRKELSYLVFRSPDLTPCDFFPLAYVKDKVYVPPMPTTLQAPQKRVTTAMTDIYGATERLDGTGLITVGMYAR
ncbi:hypothetical protein AVEN_155226-1 [Araneus ventricosus]|uniref:Uncharacterized protein n=1 Tax=Araneus ventricosus TaxID=182803 RepID=A0A4Y2EJD8_ARAVE|nr:hypothetical protein AVEN_155226-1 [Araneus ventricosus]